MDQRYGIKSAQTGQWISGDAKPGAYVTTTPFPRAAFKFEVGEPVVIESPIGGLYINPGKLTVYPPRLVWSEHRFYWRVIETPLGYRFIPANGQDAYWTQTFEDIPYIPLLRGSEIRDKESDFELVPAE